MWMVGYVVRDLLPDLQVLEVLDGPRSEQKSGGEAKSHSIYFWETNLVMEHQRHQYRLTMSW